MTPDAHATGSPSLDRLFEILCREPRRRILDALRAESPRDVEELTRRNWFGDVDGDAVEVVLYHSHLSRLDSTDLVRWDHDRGTVERGPSFDEVEPFFDLMDDHGEALPSGWP